MLGSRSAWFRGVWVWLFLFVSVWGTANQVLFTYSHLTADGRLITHAHPVEREGDFGQVPEHSHSPFSLYVVTSLQILAQVQWYCFTWLAWPTSRPVEFLDRPPHVFTPHVAFGTSRAPPAWGSVFVSGNGVFCPMFALG